MPLANDRLVRPTAARPSAALAVDLAAMTALPPAVGLAARVRLGRDYYVRCDTNDYSVDPAMIGRLVDVHATLTRVLVTAQTGEGAGRQVVADHARCWAHRVVITDPAHVATAQGLRASFTADRAARERAARHHGDGHPAVLRALGGYDELFGVDFDPIPAAAPALVAPLALVAGADPATAPAGTAGQPRQDLPPVTR